MGHVIGGRCPVCPTVMEITQLPCQQCDTAIEGHLAFSRFNRLIVEQLAFPETLVRCEGEITRVEKELGISYLTARSRLDDLVSPLGYEVRHDEGPRSLLSSGWISQSRHPKGN